MKIIIEIKVRDTEIAIIIEASTSVPSVSMMKGKLFTISSLVMEHPHCFTTITVRPWFILCACD